MKYFFVFCIVFTAFSAKAIDLHPGEHLNTSEGVVQCVTSKQVVCTSVKSTSGIFKIYVGGRYDSWWSTPGGVTDRLELLKKSGVCDIVDSD